MTEVKGEIELSEYAVKLLFKIMDLTGESMVDALNLALEEAITRHGSITVVATQITDGAPSP